MNVQKQISNSSNYSTIKIRYEILTKSIVYVNLPDCLVENPEEEWRQQEEALGVLLYPGEGSAHRTKMKGLQVPFWFGNRFFGHFS